VQSYAQIQDPALYYLRAFQSYRLRDTYADFVAKPDYKSACGFFFNKVYSTEDVSDRDAAFKKIHHLVNKFMGGEVAASMSKLIELQELTIALDQKLLNVLQEIEAPLEFGMTTYELAYALSENYSDREVQIDLLVFVNRLIHRISHKFGIGMILKGLRAGCLVTGDTRMVDFLMAGYRSYSDLKRIDPLVEAIDTRERRRLERIFSVVGAPEESE